MRKIERQMVEAIRNGRDMHVANTRVLCNGNAWTVTLHGNLIAERTSDGIMRITLAGWNTPTTRSRVNAILSAFSSCANTGYPWHISCRQFVPHLNGQPIGTHEWVEVEGAA